MQIYIYTNPQCQAAEASQLPERGAGERRLVATLAQQHLDARVQKYTLVKNRIKFSCSIGKIM